MTTLRSHNATPRRPSNQEWEAHRAELERLYVSENRPLGFLMKYMKQNHDFIAKYAHSSMAVEHPLIDM